MSRYDDYWDRRWSDQPTAEERRERIETAKKGRAATGKVLEPVNVTSRKITTTFWGNSWCTNLERYGDYANRLPRGRTYVRDGAVIHLEIQPGHIHALVSGTRVYKVDITIAAVGPAAWEKVCRDCVGSIDSMVDLLRGKLSAAVMQRVCAPGTGLFPNPREIGFECSCPDWAVMCKHVAAVLYGVGARLDQQPDLLFKLRQVDQQDLLMAQPPGPVSGSKNAKRLAAADLEAMFGVDFGVEGALVELAIPTPTETPEKPAPRPRGRARKEVAAVSDGDETPEKPAPRPRGRLRKHPVAASDQAAQVPLATPAGAAAWESAGAEQAQVVEPKLTPPNPANPDGDAPAGVVHSLLERLEALEQRPVFGKLAQFSKGLLERALSRILPDEPKR